MGTTELSIVYQILSSIRASELTNDEVVTERRVRSFLRTHRANIINKNTNSGETISDECFQRVDLKFEKISGNEWESIVPTIIKLKNNYGVKLMTPGYSNIAILSEEDYHLNKFNIINKYLPVAKLENSKLTLRIPDKSPYSIKAGKNIEMLLNCLTNNKDYVIFSAVLDNPDDGKNYDWTSSEYPVSLELLQSIKEEIWKREFQMILGTHADQVPNSKNDTLRYHDQGKVQQ